MRSAVGIDIAAPIDLVFALARDVSRWERLLPHYARSRVVGGDGDVSLCAFVARREIVPLVGLGVPVAWRARTWSESAGHRLRFVHVGGATAGMDVTWRIEAAPFGCHVTIEHDFRPRIPGWALLVDRLFTRPIAGRTLGTFRSLAEALVALRPEGRERPESDAVQTANS
jgi:hypothetical protein